MRITESEKNAILQALKRADKEAAVYLFGSRVDDNAMGGDIDLLVVSQKIDLLGKLDVLAELHRALGDQKIDLAVFPDTSTPFARMAVSSGARP